MKRLSTIFFLCLLFVSCHKAATQCSPTAQAETATASSDCTITATPATVPDSTPSNGFTTTGSTSGAGRDGATSTSGGVSTGSLPTEASTFETNVIFYNTDAAQEAKFLKAIEIIKHVVATEEFRSRILNFTYAGKKTFVDNGGMSNEEIYQAILDGAETLQATRDNKMDLEVELYTAYSSTVGYTYPNVSRIWVNTQFFNRYTPAEVAHNLFHEWLHKLGFTHAFRYSASRDSSVPYAIGDIVGELGKSYL